ncbi:MAG: glycosyltransferase [Phycisphaerae bacterium]|nr:glycosyltransferase [Tepidisphaeraceae bacterium]
MRVLHAISSLDPQSGGTTSALVGMARAQARAGLDVRVLATFAAGLDRSAVDALLEAGVAVNLVGPHSGRLCRHPALRSQAAADVARSDVVHVHALWEEVQHQVAAAAREAGKPYIFSPHGMLDPWSLRQNRLVKWAYLAWRLRKDLRSAAALHFTTEAERDLVGPLRLGTGTIVEPLGLDLAEFGGVTAADARAFRDEHGLGYGPLVLFLGRVHPKKGLDLLVPAFAEAAKFVPDARLAIVGPAEPGYDASVRSMVAAAGIADRTARVGMVRGPTRLAAFAAADVFVLPSRQENFGMAVVEALACGTPVLISDQVNIWKEIVDGRVGAVHPLVVGQLSEALRHWLGDRSLREAAAARAKDFVRTRFDWSDIGPRWRERYTTIVEGFVRR